MGCGTTVCLFPTTYLKLHFSSYVLCSSLSSISEDKDMRLTFLGTAAGTPSVERSVTALAIALDDSKEWYLVDCGEGTQHQLLKCRYTLSGLSAIFITHIHGDHMFGLPGLICSASMQGRTDPLTIYAPEGVESFVRHSLESAAVSHLPFELMFERTDGPSFSFEDQNFSVTAHGLSHRVPSFAYRFSEVPRPGSLDQNKLEQIDVPKGPLWGELQAGNSIILECGRMVDPEEVKLPPEPSRIAVIGGDNDKPELLVDAMKGADVLVHEATFTDPVYQRVGPQYMHSTAKMVGEAAEKAGIGSVILTHISGRFRKKSNSFENDIEALRQETSDVYQGTVELAEDFGCWEVTREKKLLKR